MAWIKLLARFFGTWAAISALLVLIQLLLSGYLTLSPAVVAVVLGGGLVFAVFDAWRPMQRLIGKQ